ADAETSAQLEDVARRVQALEQSFTSGGGDWELTHIGRIEQAVSAVEHRLDQEPADRPPSRSERVDNERLLQDARERIRNLAPRVQGDEESERQLEALSARAEAALRRTHALRSGEGLPPLTPGP